ncbi:MAG: hypothetical protein EP335_08190 [Alphaproteobacteria bacterium]|nr:MAG: hypothetical protein EP335_08190 [Alphaproteobacteria bacterium]
MIRHAACLLTVASGLLLAGCDGTGLETDIMPAKVDITEAGKPVLTYQLAPPPGAEAWRANYLHPVYAPSGTVITENAPTDHIHHRGLFWAWRGVFLDGKSAGDAWVGDHIRYATSLVSADEWQDGSLRLITRTNWTTDAFGEPLAFMTEQTDVTIWPLDDGKRRLDIRVALRALVSGVSLAGSDNEKGYGGLSFRFGHADTVQIASDGQTLTATPAPVQTGDTVEFSFPDVAEPGWPTEIAISCKADGVPWHNWIIRQELSMQNCAWPGRAAAQIPTDRDTVLEASLIIG